MMMPTETITVGEARRIAAALAFPDDMAAFEALRQIANAILEENDILWAGTITSLDVNGPTDTKVCNTGVKGDRPWQKDDQCPSVPVGKLSAKEPR